MIGCSSLYRYSQQQNKWYSQRCLLGHFKDTPILAIANLFAHNNLWLYYYDSAITFATAKIESSFEMGK